QRRQYNYDKRGNLTRILDTRKGQHDYHYDPLDRLTRANHSHDLQERFVHDPAGNLLMQDRVGPSVVKGNRLLMQGDRHYDYDAFGNLLRERRGRAQQLVTEYRYDCQHRLISVTQPDGTEATYRYDPFGRRIAKTLNGQTTEFFWQGETLIAEHSTDNHQSYIYEPNSFRPLALLKGYGPEDVKPFHYQLDHLGTPQELTASDGEIVWSAHYRAYGQIAKLDVNTVTNPLRFQGQYFDPESGLHYNRHRYYNPDVGRYLTPDPVKLAGGLNGYQYVPNPTGWVDQLGLVCTPGQCPGSTNNTAVSKVPGGGLAAHEAAGGHLIERHVGQTTAQLASRLVAEPNIPAASTFQNLTTAESVVSRSLASHNQQIHTFLSGSTDKLIIRDRHQKPVGLSLIRGSSQTIPVYKLLLVLKRDRTMPDGYLILTGYPIP
ncbi:RNase A-like domain-containing protein, partial [Pseudomonas sp.]|nr:RHS domain-containing protein [Pseudomonadota bacterium]